jgi:membrane AbrB-like protein
VGWSIGLRFTRAILIHAARAFARVAASILALIVVSGVLAAFLVATVGVDPLSAYLATSPGGADSVAIIAASTKVDLPFVMTMQALRMAVVLVMGPSLLRFLANSVNAVNARAQGAGVEEGAAE